MALAPNSAEPYNAMGTLKASEGKTAEAEKLYRDSLARDAKLLAARHNLALLLVATNRRPEAIQAWRENLAQSPDHLPSRLSLAETLADSGDRAGAIEQYRQVLALKPGYPAARVALAGQLAKNGDPDGALEELRSTVSADAKNASALELMGDIESGRGRSVEARQAYSLGLKATSDRGARKRMQEKLKSLK
jgi:tetratricopeptide (TPR) repeat protein